MHKTQSIIFPGQGSQEAHMGRDLAEHWSDAMELWKKAEQISGLPLREIYWDQDEKAMAATENLQPALTVVNMNLWCFLTSRLRPGGVAGHSLGEFAALFAAGVLSAEQLLELVSLRGRLMSECRNQDGHMAAVLRLSESQVQALVHEAATQTGLEIRIANYNTPVQFVVSGHAQAVDHVRAAAKAIKGRGVPLPVSNAFHSPYMAEAEAELAGYMDRLDWRDPSIPIYLNVTARPEPDGRALCRAMKKQMTSSVLWTQSIRNQYEDGLRTFVELGPKGVLSRMIAPILKDKDDVAAVNINTLEQTAQVDSLA
jgi:[acyl-carrier-protein] S-malonyltransferase